MTNDEIKEGLGYAAVFRGLEAEDLDILLEFGELRDARKGELIIREGRHSEGLMILLEGRADIYKGAGESRHHLLASQGRGAIFGERALLDDLPAIASVRAERDCRYYFLPKDSFYRLAAQHTRVAWRMVLSIARVGAKRLDKMNQKVVELLEASGRTERLAEMDSFRNKLFTEWDF